MWNKATWANKTKLKEIKEERPNRHVFSSKILFILRILFSAHFPLPLPAHTYITMNGIEASSLPSLSHMTPPVDAQVGT